MSKRKRLDEGKEGKECKEEIIDLKVNEMYRLMFMQKEYPDIRVLNDQYIDTGNNNLCVVGNSEIIEVILMEYRRDGPDKIVIAFKLTRPAAYLYVEPKPEVRVLRTLNKRYILQISGKKTITAFINRAKLL